MRNFLVSVVLLAFLVSFCGCVISIGNRRPDNREQGCPEYVSASCRGTLAEIEAAGNLMMESDKTAALKNIARRGGISDVLQVCLVETATSKLMMESSKEDVLLTLIANESFGSEGKARVLKRINRLMMESSKIRVLEAINSRGAM